MIFKEFKDCIESGLDELNLDYDDNKIIKLWDYMNFLLKENKKYNLTNITDEKEVIKKHFYDSLAPLTMVKIDFAENILDLGTGPGFPGMVWKIFFPKKKFFLLDSTLKKVNFLKLLSVELELYNNLEIKHGRAETFAKNNKYREKYDLVLSRAVAPLNILAEYTLPFTSKNGLLYFFKGPDYKKEIKNSKNSFKKLGGKHIDTIELKIPGLDAERYLLIYKKVKNTSKKFPRRAGIPKKRPL